MEKFTTIYPEKIGLIRESKAMPATEAFLFLET